MGKYILPAPQSSGSVSSSHIVVLGLYPTTPHAIGSHVLHPLAETAKRFGVTSLSVSFPPPPSLNFTRIHSASIPLIWEDQGVMQLKGAVVNQLKKDRRKGVVQNVIMWQAWKVWMLEEDSDKKG